MKIKQGVMDWIRVEDRLPGKNDFGYWGHSVRVFWELDGSKHSNDAQWLYNENLGNIFAWNGINITKYVTHWMPLPKPPLTKPNK